MNECKKCQDLNINYKISLPNHLAKAIGIAKENVADGTLEVVKRGEWCVAFDQVSDEAPWDDIIYYKFRCTACGALFELTAETYHGGGGSWSPLHE